MPPRFSYWTIIAGGLPTAFRAADREELLPTFTRLKQKQPDAEMKWFQRGKLWSSPEEARGERDRPFSRDSRGERSQDRDRPRRKDGAGDARGRDWRPGGEHRDPRQPFKDAKKARNQRFKAEKFARRSGRDEAPREKPHGDPVSPDRRTRHEGPHGAAAPNRKPWTATPAGKSDWRPSGPAGMRPRGKPDHPKRDWQKRGDKPQSRPGSPPAGPSAWLAKPPREKPHGDKLARPPRTGDARERPSTYRDRPASQRDRSDRDRPRPEARGAYRGQGHGDNSWKARPPRDDRGPDSRGQRPFAPRGFERDHAQSKANQSPSRPPAPRGPNREPKPSENPAPSPPPRPHEPAVRPPGPPERGRLNRNKRQR